MNDYNKINVFSQFMLEDGSHITYDFNPGKCILPIPEGATAKAIAVGYYEDNNVGCYIYNVILKDGTIIKTQPSGILLHSTYFTDGKTSPAESGARATKLGYTKFREHCRVEVITASFFKSNKRS